MTMTEYTEYNCPGCTTEADSADAHRGGDRGHPNEGCQAGRGNEGERPQDSADGAPGLHRDNSQPGTNRNCQGVPQVTFIFIESCIYQILSSRDLFDGKVPSKHENKLRLCFKELLKKSGDALKRNRQFIKKDQEAYQNQLEKSYHQCMEYLKPLIQPAGAPANLPLGVR